MANDHPTSLRMLFGYYNARQAGLGGVRADRSPREINKISRSNKLIKELLREVETDPEWEPFVVHWIKNGFSIESTMASLQRAKSYAWYKSRGYKRQDIVDYVWPYF